MTILLTGGTGKTGLRLARLLRDSGRSVLLASRSGTAPEQFDGVQFDWLDPSTHENPFKADHGIDRVYLICPLVTNSLTPMKPFIELAITRGVKRFVLLSATAIPQGGPAMGQVHEYLARRGVEYAVLQPSWFFENFTLQFLSSLRNEDFIFSSAKDGRIPFVSTDDIAEVALKALTEEESHNSDYIIVGPEAYSYDEVAALLSEVLGRKITHKRLSDDEAEAIWTSFQMPEEFVSIYIAMEHHVAAGNEEAFFYAEQKEVGKRHLLEYFKENRALWIPK